MLISPEIKLHILPVYTHIIHTGAYSGPCRPGGSKQEQDYDERVSLEYFDILKAKLSDYFDDSIVILEPVYLQMKDDFYVRDEDVDKLSGIMDQTDAVLSIGHQKVTCDMALRFHKPVISLGCCYGTDPIAKLKDLGMEAYGYIDLEHMRKKIHLLRVKKAVAQTKVLSVLKDNPVTVGVTSCISDLDKLEKVYGIRFHCMESREVLDAVENLSDSDMEKAREITKELVENADSCAMEPEYVLRSVRFYVAVKNYLEKYNCNAFTIPCFEICATRVLNNQKYVFCLGHSLLKEDGIPSACESDINVLLALILLMNLTDSAPHMGNLHPVVKDYEFALTTLPPEELQKCDNLIRIEHAVTTRMMKGRHQAKSPYSIRSFTTDAWGATMGYDFDLDKGKTVTFLRFGPSGTKLMVATGEIVKAVDDPGAGCAVGFYAKVNDVEDFFQKQQQVGHHFAWVYGDISKEIIELAALWNLEVLES